MVIVVGDVQLVRMLLHKFLELTLVSVVSFFMAFAKKNSSVVLILFFFFFEFCFVAPLPMSLKFNLV